MSAMSCVTHAKPRQKDPRIAAVNGCCLERRWSHSAVVPAHVPHNHVGLTERCVQMPRPSDATRPDDAMRSTGEVLDTLEMPGWASRGSSPIIGDQVFCGGGSSGKVRTVRRPPSEAPRPARPAPRDKPSLYT